MRTAGETPVCFGYSRVFFAELNTWEAGLPFSPLRDDGRSTSFGGEGSVIDVIMNFFDVVTCYFFLFKAEFCSPKSCLKCVKVMTIHATEPYIQMGVSNGGCAEGRAICFVASEQRNKTRFFWCNKSEDAIEGLNCVIASLLTPQ